MKFERKSVRELSEEYLIPARTIRDRINQHGFGMTFVRRKDGVREFPVTSDFIDKVLSTHPRFKNLRRNDCVKTKEIRLPVKDIRVKPELSRVEEDVVSVTLVFGVTDVRKLVKFIRSFGGK